MEPLFAVPHSPAQNMLGYERHRCGWHRHLETLSVGIVQKPGGVHIYVVNLSWLRRDICSLVFFVEPGTKARNTHPLKQVSTGCTADYCKPATSRQMLYRKKSTTGVRRASLSLLRMHKLPPEIKGGLTQRDTNVSSRWASECCLSVFSLALRQNRRVHVQHVALRKLGRFLGEFGQLQPASSNCQYVTLQRCSTIKLLLCKVTRQGTQGQHCTITELSWSDRRRSHKLSHTDN